MREGRGGTLDWRSPPPWFVVLSCARSSCSRRPAQDAADRLASARPYTPTVHALILPSQLPIDLRIQFRDLEEVFFVGRSTVYSGMPLTTIPQNDADGPDHMNILSSRGAQTQVCSFFFGADESHIGRIAPNVFLDQVTAQRQEHVAPGSRRISR